jgi:hypothetical protein
MFTPETLRAPDRPDLSSPDATGRGEQQGSGRRPRFARAAVVWLAGVLGTAGCVLGVCMPYHHPVAVVISALWWGTYLGWLGGSVGALIALLAEGAPALPSRVVGGRSCSAATTLNVCSVPQE